MKKHYRHENDCLNCGTQLQGKFCHQCGQENLQIKESFFHMLNHAVSDYFHFDHQFFHTIKPLLVQPGKLTLDYLAGRRAQYLHPIKMYIFISLVFFLLVFKTGHNVIKTEDAGTVNKEINKNLKDNLDRDSSLTEEQKRSIRSTVNSVLPSSAGKVQITERRNNAPISISNKQGSDTTYAQYQASQAKLPADKRDGFIQRFGNKAIFAYQAKYGERAIEQFVDDVRHNIPKMMFVLLPLFALILMITFWRDRKFYVEHIIYAIHLHCFIYLVWAVILLIQLLLPHNLTKVVEWMQLLMFLYITYYVYRSLRVLYNRSRWVTIFKMVTMSVIYWTVFIVCAAGLIAIVAAQA